MSHSTRKFHENLIRLIKGMITSWEEWLKAQPLAPGKVQATEPNKKS